MCKTERTKHAKETTATGDFVAMLDRLASMPRRFQAFVDAVPPARWRTRPSDGAFSLQEHACHLRDIEIEAYRVRLERMLAEEMPALADVDGAALARTRDYHRQDLATAQAVFAAVRADMVQRLASLTPEERRRTGVLEGIGEITVDDLVGTMLEHDAEHLGDLDQLRRELRD
jgi:uncharacterized damage-inducible protein DinB